VEPLLIVLELSAALLICFWSWRMDKRKVGSPSFGLFRYKETPMTNDQDKIDPNSPTKKSS